MNPPGEYGGVRGSIETLIFSLSPFSFSKMGISSPSSPFSLPCSSIALVLSSLRLTRASSSSSLVCDAGSALISSFNFRTVSPCSSANLSLGDTGEALNLNAGSQPSTNEASSAAPSPPLFASTTGVHNWTGTSSWVLQEVDEREESFAEFKCPTTRLSPESPCSAFSTWFSTDLYLFISSPATVQSARGAICSWSSHSFPCPFAPSQAIPCRVSELIVNSSLSPAKS